MCALPDAQLINNLVPFPLGILKWNVDRLEFGFEDILVILGVGKNTLGEVPIRVIRVGVVCGDVFGIYTFFGQEEKAVT